MEFHEPALQNLWGTSRIIIDLSQHQNSNWHVFDSTINITTAKSFQSRIDDDFSVLWTRNRLVQSKNTPNNVATLYTQKNQYATLFFEFLSLSGEGVKKNYTTVDSRFLRLPSDFDGHGTAITWKEWRLLLLLFVKKQCISFVWDSQGAVCYSHRSEWLWFADCCHIFYFSQNKRLNERKNAVSPDHQHPQPSIYIDKCTVYTYTVYMYTAL